MAALYSANKLDLLDGGERFAAFHVSGGTTEILLVTPYDGGFFVELVGGTADINAGQAIDRTGVLMGLGFPCGREMENIIGGQDIPRSKTRISVKELKCNLSGLENLATEIYERTQSRELTSAYVFEYVSETLGKMTRTLRAEHPNIPVIYAGGVMSNKIIKKRLQAIENTYFAEPQYSADNAVGIALLCRRRHLSEI